MRSIYLGKPRFVGGSKGGGKSWANSKKPECPACGGPLVARVVGQTLGGKPLYSCKSEWHIWPHARHRVMRKR